MSAPADPAVTRPRRYRLLGAVISVLALVLVVKWAVDQPAPSLPDTPVALALVLLAVGVYFLNAVGRGFRWHVILRDARISHQRADAYGLIAVAHFGNTVLPARGGELGRILLMSDRSDGRRTETLGTFITERILDASLLLVLFAVISSTPAGRAIDRSPAIISVAALCLGIAAAVLYLRLRIAGRFERFAARVRPVLRSSRPLLSRRGLELASLTAIIWLGEGVVFWLVAEALGVHLAPQEAMFVVLLASFSGMIPSAPGYAGTLDAAVMLGLKAVGVGGGAAVGCLVMYRFVVFVPLTLVGLTLLIARYGGVGALRRRQKARDAPAVAATHDPSAGRAVGASS